MEVIQPPRLRRLYRLAWGAAGISWFFWLAYEDRGLTAVMIVAVLGAAAMGLTILDRWLGSAALPPATVMTRSTLAGLGVGTAVVPMAVILIAVKVSLHDHPVPDFTAADVTWILRRVPIWAGAGLLTGLASGLTLGFAYNEPTEPKGSAGGLPVTEEIVIYVCKRCTTSAGEGGTCIYCGGERVACRPGDDGDPDRRPLIDDEGNVLTRAPIWWLRYTIPGLMDQTD